MKIKKEVNGFNLDGKISSNLSEKSTGCHNENGLPTSKLQSVLLHNNVLELTKTVESMHNTIKNLEKRIVELENEIIFKIISG